ncbi:MAG: MBL fold metallo-hydrolase [Cyanobacteria bacterium]|nr:MBL fold metallo-hydrolase [Cyanobacteriota bacterium]
MLPLEDFYSDVIQKAQRGLRLTDSDLAERSGVSVTDLNMLKQSSELPSNSILALEKVAFVLGLSPKALVAMAEKKWYPHPQNPIPGFAMFTTDLPDMTVNSYLIWDPTTKEATSYDTGSTCEPMLVFLKENRLTLKQSFITHTHQDHIMDLEKLLGSSDTTGYGSAIDNALGVKPLVEGDGLTLGCLRIRVLKTSGHTPGGQSYWVQGLKKSFVVVGDALFASSMGGAAFAYQEALTNNREKILSLPLETIICPGHGPLTTVGEERANNPFFASFFDKEIV